MISGCTEYQRYVRVFENFMTDELADPYSLLGYTCSAVFALWCLLLVVWVTVLTLVNSVGE